MSLLILIDMVIKSYHIILAVKILGWFLLKWAGFGELLGWKSSIRSGNTESHYKFCDGFNCFCFSQQRCLVYLLVTLDKVFADTIA